MLHQKIAAPDPVPDSHGQNLYHADRDLDGLLRLYLDQDLFLHLRPHFERLGELAGGHLDTLAATADKNGPQLHVRDRQGHDCNRIVKHPAYVELERWAFSTFGLAAASHVPVLGWHAPLPAVAKYTLFYLFAQAEFGLTCPLNMTDSLTRTLKKYGHPDLVRRYVGALTSLDFDACFQGAMFMTEQGAGSDIAQTATRAEQVDGGWRLHGDKWFCSNATADLAMVLARPSDAPAGMAGVTLFLMPRLTADGRPNAYRIVRLKEKLGTRAMASGEIRLEGAEAYLIGEVGKGFQQMAEMVNSSRLSNGVRSAGLMRRAVSEALFVAGHRTAFGKRLDAFPLMQRQLAKIILPTEQARTFAFHTALALQRADGGDAEARRLVRIMTPLIKFRACRDARAVTTDAMEVRGGCGYIEEWTEPRLVREAVLGSIWEGTSNIVALDVYRAIVRENALDAYGALLRRLLGESAATPGVNILGDRLDALIAHAGRSASGRNESEAREVASALYHLGTAIMFGWEARHPGLGHRASLMGDVLEHRLEPVLQRLIPRALGQAGAALERHPPGTGHGPGPLV